MILWTVAKHYQVIILLGYIWIAEFELNGFSSILSIGIVRYGEN